MILCRRTIASAAFMPAAVSSISLLRVSRTIPSGATIFLGLPVARMRGLPTAVQGVLNAFATGILVFLLWDILSHAGGPLETALSQWTTNQGTRAQPGPGPFVLMAAIFAVGIGAG